MRHTFDYRSFTSLRSEAVNLVSAPSLFRERSEDLPPMTSASVQTLTVVHAPSVESVDNDLDAEPELWLSEALPSAKFFGCQDLRWTQLTDRAPAGSSQTIMETDIAVYRIGEGDPNQIIADALAQGASGILTEQLLPCPLPQCIVGSVDRALADIAAHQNNRPDRKLLTVGVLGSSGKTSTCIIAATLTESFGLRTAYQCDLGTNDGVLKTASDTPVPAGAPLIDWLSEASDCCSRLALVEIDATAARDGHYDSIEFDILLVTQKSQPNDDFAPCPLQCVLDRLTPSGVVICPESDSRALKIIGKHDANSIRYGTHAECEFAAIPIDQSGGMSTLMLATGDTSVMTETPLCGLAMAGNIAAASALVSLMGHSLHDIAQNLTKLRSIPGRGQRLIDFGRATVVLESGGKADRVSQALRTAKTTGGGGRVWCVLAIGETDTADELAQYGQMIERFSDHCVVTSRANQAGSFLNRSHQLLDGVTECAGVRLVADQNKAIEWAIASSRPRDTVVIFTNQSGMTAADEANLLDGIKATVDSAREPIEPNSPGGSTESLGTKISLKLFPG